MAVCAGNNLAARRAQSIDDLDGDDVGRADGLLALGQVAVDDGVEVEPVPQPAGEEHVAEAAGVGPGDVVEANADDVGVVRERHLKVVGKESELLGVALPVVENDGALPAAFLIGVEFAEVGDDPLPRPGVGEDALDERELAVGFADLGPRVTTQKHLGLQSGNPGRGSLPTVFPRHRVLGSNPR